MEENVEETIVLTEQEKVNVWADELQSMKDNGTLGAFIEVISSIHEDMKQWAEEERLFDEEFTRENGYSFYTGVPDDWVQIPPVSPGVELQGRGIFSNMRRGDEFVRAWPIGGTDKEQTDFMCKWFANEERDIQIEIRQMIKEDGLERLSREELQPYLQKWVDEGRFL